MQKKWISGILFMIAAAASAFPPGVTVEPAGNLTICGLSGGVIVFNKNWQQTKQNARNILAEPGYPVPSEKVYEHKGVLKIPGTEGFTFQQWVKEKKFLLRHIFHETPQPGWHFLPDSCLEP